MADQTGCEMRDFLNSISLLYKPEMVRSIFLTKATSWYEANAHLLEQSHAVEHVRSLTIFLHAATKSKRLTLHNS